MDLLKKSNFGITEICVIFQPMLEMHLSSRILIKFNNSRKKICFLPIFLISNYTGVILWSFFCILNTWQRILIKWVSILQLVELWTGQACCYYYYYYYVNIIMNIYFKICSPDSRLKVTVCFFWIFQVTEWDWFLCEVWY